MTDAVRRTGPDEWRVVDELYPSLRRFAAVTAPFDLDPDDLLQEALVKVLGRRALSDLDHPAAYLQRTMINLAASRSLRRPRRPARSGMSMPSTRTQQAGWRGSARSFSTAQGSSRWAPTATEPAPTAIPSPGWAPGTAEAYPSASLAASSSRVRASTNSSMSPSRIWGSRLIVMPMRWSVTRFSL